MPAPTDLTALLDEAKSCVRHRQPRRAIELFGQALALDGLQTAAYEGLAAAHVQLDDWPQAAAQFRRLSELQPRNGRALINLGAAYNRLGEYQQAVDTLRRGLQKESRCSEGYYNLGIAERKLGNRQLAAAAYRETIRIKPQMAEAHQNLANLLLEMGQTQQALLHYRKALEIAPDFEKARRGLQQAEAAAAQARQPVSIFGRLVEAEARQDDAASSSVRSMGLEERLRDRREVAELATEIHTAAANCVEQLRDHLEPALLALTRAVAQPDTSGRVLLTAFAGFRTAARQTADCHDRLQSSTRALHQHEEAMATDDTPAAG